MCSGDAEEKEEEEDGGRCATRNLEGQDDRYEVDYEGKRQ